MTKGTPSGRVIVCVLLHVKQAAEQASIALAPAADGRLSAADPPRLAADPSRKHGRRKPVWSECWFAGEQNKKINPQTPRQLVYTFNTERNRKQPRRQKRRRRRRRRGKRRRLTEDSGVPPRGEQAPERHVHQHLEADLVEGGRVGEGLQPSLHRLRQLHFVKGVTHDTRPRDASADAACGEAEELKSWGERDSELRLRRERSPEGRHGGEMFRARGAQSGVRGTLRGPWGSSEGPPVGRGAIYFHFDSLQKDDEIMFDYFRHEFKQLFCNKTYKSRSVIKWRSQRQSLIKCGPGVWFVSVMRNSLNLEENC